MLGCRMPDWKYNPLIKKAYEIRKKKRLEWAKRHGCYEEVKQYYEKKEWIRDHVIY